MTDTRSYWVQTLDQIARPVFEAAASNQLPQVMKRYTDSLASPLEAFARSFAGIAPWLELEEVPAVEASLQAEYREMAQQALAYLSDPANDQRYFFTNEPGVSDQALVDAAFLAHGLLRAKTQITEKLPQIVKDQLIQALKSSRNIVHHNNNWILFSAMVEAGLDVLGSDFDLMRIDYGIQLINRWYKGDGIYGDGEEFANDYYNSFVIQPFLVDLIKRYPIIVTNAKIYDKELPDLVMKRATRFAQYQELLINCDGTYPVYGRSMCYRFGCFQHLAQACLEDFLPVDVTPAQVRSGLTAVICKVMSAKSNFDDHGFLTVGVFGAQPDMGESYINVGSCYLALQVMLPLGIPADQAFWQAPEEDWSAKKIWSGQLTHRDHAYHEFPGL